MPRTNFCREQIKQYLTIRKSHPTFSESTGCAQQIVNNFVRYYKHLYDKDTRPRKNSFLMSAQTYISQFKRDLHQEDPSVPKTFLQLLRLNKSQNAQIILQKNQNVHNNAIRLPAVNGDDVIQDCKKCLTKGYDPYKLLIALACLTGRRVTELLVTIQFDPPKHIHKSTHPSYWCHATGFLKQRAHDPNRVTTREIPLLEKRSIINKVLRQVREELGTGYYDDQHQWHPIISKQQANAKYAKQISRKMQKYCTVICNIHQFRKFYALACFQYFNENHCSLPRVASDYLGHKSLSNTILTYLNFRVVELGKLQYNV